MDANRPVMLCISTYEKGQRFLREAARLGSDVLLLTVEKFRDGDWPKDVLAGFHTMAEQLPPEQVALRVAQIARDVRIDRVVALDEFDLEAAALVREEMRLPGMGQSLTRHFRDKLAMRVRAQMAGVAVPEFVPIYNYDELRAFMAAVRAPWLLKPRTSAAAIGIRWIDEPERLWRTLDELGERQHGFVLERYVPGDIFHVDSVTWGGQVLHQAAHRYGTPPFEVMHQGGVFTTRALDRDGEEAKALHAMDRAVLKALGMTAGVTHTEFIRSHADGRVYFLETAARVGGAYIADVVEYACGLNPWVEWARIESALMHGETYRLPELKTMYAGSVICLARQAEPDVSGFTEGEIVYRLRKDHHAGLIVRSESAERVRVLLAGYAERFAVDFCATAPVPERPTA